MRCVVVERATAGAKQPHLVLGGVAVAMKLWQSAADCGRGHAAQNDSYTEYRIQKMMYAYAVKLCWNMLGKAWSRQQQQQQLLLSSTLIL
jgi:hypothetical protein